MQIQVILGNVAIRCGVNFHEHRFVLWGHKLHSIFCPNCDFALAFGRRQWLDLLR